MTHYTIDYSDLPEDEKFFKAVQDCRDWFGDRFEPLVRDLGGAMREEGMTEDRAIMLLSLGGVEGYPAEAMVKFAAGWRPA